MTDQGSNNQEAAGDALKKQTARISLEHVMSSGTDESKVANAPSAAAKDLPPAGPAKTIRLKKPATGPLFVKPAAPATPARPSAPKDPKSTTTVLREMSDADAAPTVKKETSRIVLRTAPHPPAPPADEEAVDLKGSTSPITGIPLSPSGMPQTIRLKRPSTAKLAVNPGDLSTAATKARPAAPATARMTAAPTVARTAAPATSRISPSARPPASMKSETSRIMLDDLAPARSGDARHATAPIAGTPNQPPQTIRLKRPSNALTINDDSEEAVDVKSQTAKIDLPQQSDETNITQRKTIKIKRTERNVAPRTLVLKRPDKTAQDAGQPAGTPADAPGVEEAAAAPVVGWPFACVAAAALVCAVGLAYLLAAQAMGPEVALPVPASLM
ncbi:MAG: hypothetical protein ABR497_04460 [Kiritimatiellia bacterium]